jgi:exopolysaccharide biosynthesis polyprenyl glycosylphosphotransferase
MEATSATSARAEAVTSASAEATRILVEEPSRPRHPIDGVQELRWRDALGRRSLAIADIGAVYVSLALVVILGGGHLLWPGLVVGPLLVVIAKSLDLYDRDEHLLHKTTVDEVPVLFGLATVTTLICWLGDSVIVSGHLTKAQVLELWLVTFVLLVSLRAVARALASAAATPERCLVLGGTADADLLRKQFELGPSIRADVVGVMPSLVGSPRPGRLRLPDGIGEVLVEEDVHRVIIARPPGALEGADGLLDALRQLRGYGVKVSLLPKGPRVAGPRVQLDQLPGVTLLGIRGLEMSRSSRLIKRAFDVASSGLGLILLSPLLLAIALAIRFDSPGPILFRQRRVGRRGRDFTMLKFRSMVSEAEQLKDELRDLSEGGPGLFKIADDPRVTRVGRVLRRLSLDELPQLWNVLRGDMSLVGPRPLIREEDGQIEGWYRRRLEVAPGMTGHWQILHSSRRIPLAEMAKLDYLYVANWTLWNDIRLLLRTLPFILGGRGV